MTQLTAATEVTVVGSTRPMSMFKGRFQDLYGVNGYGRGFRWDGANTMLEPLGITKPSVMTAPTASGTGAGYISNVQIIDGGAGYYSPPTVTFSGGGATTQAQAQAYIQNGRVAGVTITYRGAGYTGNPVVSFAGGQGTSAAFTVNLQGEITGFRITSAGAGYTGAPTLTIGNTNGLTNHNAVVNVDTTRGILIGYNLLSGGTGATTTGVTASVTGGGATTQGALIPIMRFSVHSVSVAHSGAGYFSPPIITIIPDPADPTGSGALLQSSVNTSGNITGVTVISGGQYSLPPTARVINSEAKALATMQEAIKGIYQVCIRYIDDTVTTQGGPIPSSISDLKEVDCTTGYATLNYTFDHSAAESRVAGFEIWRTTADQKVALYRVAALMRSAGVLPTSFSESLSDKDLLNPERDITISGHSSVYGMMPIVLPSGQLNARRFEVPPTNMAVGCMFQDRAWYSVNTDGTKPNSLFFSEIDEPESVPAANELIVQENANDSDAITALVPFGSALLIGQNRHIYRLSYVAQPVFDANIQLVSYRGIMHNRCWDVFAGVVFIADDYGIYAFTGSQEQAISAPIDNYWRDGIIDFSKKDKFFLKVNPQDRVVRFFYLRSGDGTYPTRALCFSIATETWWEETYAQPVPCATVAPIGGKQDVIYGAGSGGFLKQSGITDATTSGTTSVPYQYRTPPIVIVNEKATVSTPSMQERSSRSLSVLYTPTTVSCPVFMGLHYNNSNTARANAIDTNRGGGFTTAAGSTSAVLDMALTRSSLGNANGKATAYISGRADNDRSVGADRHVAIAFSGTQAEQVKIHGLTLEGVG